VLGFVVIRGARSQSRRDVGKPLRDHKQSKVVTKEEEHRSENVTLFHKNIMNALGAGSKMWWKMF